MNFLLLHILTNTWYYQIFQIFPSWYVCIVFICSFNAWLLLLLLSRLSRVRLCATPETAAHQAPPFLGFSRQEHWSGLPFPPAGDLPDPGIEPASLTSLALDWGEDKPGSWVCSLFEGSTSHLDTYSSAECEAAMCIWELMWLQAGTLVKHIYCGLSQPRCQLWLPDSKG